MAPSIQISHGQAARVQQPELDNPLPAEFVAETMRKVELHVTAGNWEMAKDSIDASRAQFEAERAAASIANVQLSDHVTALQLDVRTTNTIDVTGISTVGALLECFPAAFVRLPNCGPTVVRKIAEALLRAGLIDEAGYRRRINEYIIQAGRKIMHGRLRELEGERCHVVIGGGG